MLVLTAHITIGNLVFRHATAVTCTSGWQAMGDKCTVTLPRNVAIRGKRIRDLVKPGDAATVAVGYGRDLSQLITGKVVRVSPELPISIDIEDEFYDLRRSTVSKSWPAVTLKDLLTDLVPGTALSVPGISLGKFRIDQVTKARVLLELQKIYGIYSWFRGGVLHSGFAYAAEPAAVHKFHFQKNVISSSLTYVEEDERKIKVRAISFMPDGSTLSVDLGDAEGDQRTLHYYELDATQLKAIAQAEMGRLKVSGYEGEIVTFGRPPVMHGDAVELTDGYNPDRTGQYFVDQVITTWGASGFRQNLKLGKRA